jgi:hypothetical protein
MSQSTAATNMVSSHKSSNGQSNLELYDIMRHLMIRFVDKTCRVNLKPSKACFDHSRQHALRNQATDLAPRL